jgi:hypothetical protein
MSANSEPEKYSFEEMMERLKNRAAEPTQEEGELVTRADGSVVIKVRRRKRRSHQPHKTQEKRSRRTRVIQVSAALLLLLISTLVVGMAMAYANSAPFRKNAVRMIAAKSGADVTLEQFRISPTRANAGRITMAWSPEKVLKELTARGASAAITPSVFFGKSLAGEEVSVTDVAIRLGFPEPGSVPAETGQPQAAAPVRFKRYTTSNLAVSFERPGQPLFVLRDAEASFEPLNANLQPQILLSRGTLSFPPWPAFKLDRAHIEMRDGEINIVGMRLQHPDDTRGVIDLTGAVTPHAADRPSALAVRMESFPFHGIIGQDFGKLITGRIDTITNPQSNFLSLAPGPEPEASLNLSFQKSLSSPVELTGFKFLTDFARLSKDNWFERPVFELEARGSIRRSGGKVMLEELNFEHKGRMAMRGWIASDASGRLSGQIRVGVSEAVLLATENFRLLAIFGPEDDGFRWIPLEISGNCKQPNDDFLKRYELTPAARDSAPGRGGISSFDDLINPE